MFFMCLVVLGSCTRQCVGQRKVELEASAKKVGKYEGKWKGFAVFLGYTNQRPTDRFIQKASGSTAQIRRGKASCESVGKTHAFWNLPRAYLSLPLVKTWLLSARANMSILRKPKRYSAGSHGTAATFCGFGRAAKIGQWLSKRGRAPGTVRGSGRS